MSGTHMKAVYTRARSGGTEDVAVTTHDFHKDSGDHTDSECDTIAAAYAAFWAALCVSSAGSGLINTGTTLTELRFYKGYDGDGSPGAVDYVKTYSSAGLNVGSMCPPQVSCTVTELTDSRRHWGRFYLPGITSNALNPDGTLKSTIVTSVANAAENFYEAVGAMAGTTPVVWGRKTSSISYLAVAPPRWRPSWVFPSSSVSVGDPIAMAVQSIRVDEILDIQRRRRWESTLNRVTRVLG
jgi:hypothetical protein